MRWGRNENRGHKAPGVAMVRQRQELRFRACRVEGSPKPLTGLAAIMEAVLGANRIVCGRPSYWKKS